MGGAGLDRADARLSTGGQGDGHLCNGQRRIAECVGEAQPQDVTAQGHVDRLPECRIDEHVAGLGERGRRHVPRLGELGHRSPAGDPGDRPAAVSARGRDSRRLALRGPARRDDERHGRGSDGKRGRRECREVAVPAPAGGGPIVAFACHGCLPGSQRTRMLSGGPNSRPRPRRGRRSAPAALWVDLSERRLCTLRPSDHMSGDGSIDVAEVFRSDRRLVRSEKTFAEPVKTYAR